MFFTGAELTGTNSSNFTVNYNDNAPCGNTAANSAAAGQDLPDHGVLRSHRQRAGERQLQGVRQQCRQPADSESDGHWAVRREPPSAVNLLATRPPGIKSGGLFVYGKNGSG